MSFAEAISAVFSKYATFSGRSRRSEYWYFFLLNIIVSVVVNILVRVVGLSVFSLIGGLWSLATVIPGLAVAIRRLHDIGKSGWWILIGLIPIVGVIWLVVLYAKESQGEDNKYGSMPY